MTKDEALKMAHEALEANYQLINGTDTEGGLVCCIDGYYSDCFDEDPINEQTEKAITAIKEVLAQPEQEHFALKHRIAELEGAVIGLQAQLAQPEQDSVAMADYMALMEKYAFLKAQRTWVGLTDKEIETIWRKVEAGDFHDCVLPFAEKLEAKLKELNT